VLLAFYLRYPNPHATHVLSCDVISRQVDPIRGAITTQRLILKKGIVPRWARTWLENWGMMGGGGLEAWVLEESEVGLENPHFTPRGHRFNIANCDAPGDNRCKHESAGLDINDEKHLAQEDHSCCRRCSVPSSCSSCSVRSHILPILVMTSRSSILHYMRTEGQFRRLSHTSRRISDLGLDYHRCYGAGSSSTERAASRGMRETCVVRYDIRSLGLEDADRSIH
jgi:hypothetical protein